MMDVKRTNPNGGRSILVPPKATIKFETAAGPKFGPGPEAKPKPAAIQRAGSRQRSAGKDSSHGPDSSRLGTADSGISVSSASEALLHRRGSGTGEPLLFRRGSGTSLSLLPDPGIALGGDAFSLVETAVQGTSGVAGISEVGAGAEAISAKNAAPSLSIADDVAPKAEDFGTVSSSHVEIQLSDAVLEAFMQNSPSRTSLLHSPHSHLKQTPAVTHMAKLRVVEEMSRIQQRAYVTEQQRTQLMQTALSMDAPKLARRIIQDEKDHDEAVAAPLVRGIAEGSGDNPHSASAVSFLTAGELLMIDRRILEEQNIADELKQNAGNDENYFSDVTNTPHEQHGAEEDSGVDENEVTIKRTKSFRLREELQTQEDGRFAKAVEEVERIRQRFIAKAQLPIFGSVSTVEKVVSNVDLAAARDIYSNIHNNMSGSASTAHVGAKVRKTGNGMLFSSRGSFHIDEAPSFAGDLARHHSAHSSGNNSGGTSANITRQNSKRSDKYATTTSSSSSHHSNKGNLSLEAPDDSTSYPDYPPLSPAKNTTGVYFPAKRQGSYSVTHNTLSPKVDNVSGADSVSSRGSNTSTNSTNFPSYPVAAHNVHVLNTIPDSPNPKNKSIRPVPLLNSGSIENLHTSYDNFPTSSANASTNAQYGTAPYVNPFEAFERASAAQIVKIGTFENPSEDFGGTRQGRKFQRKTTDRTSQQQVADDIDDLIGSRFNSARDPEEPPEAGEILGNSLVLLQRQLDSAAFDKPQQYSRNVSNNHTLDPAASAAAGSNAKLSAAAATTLATLTRPGSASRRNNALNAHNVHSTPTSETEDILSVHITHGMPPVHSPTKSPHIEIDAHNPRSYREQRSGGRGSERSDGRPLLHSDDSTSSIGSAMFAFRLDSKSTEITPASARRDFPNRDPRNITADTPSPDQLGSDSGSARGKGKSRYERGIQNTHEVSRGLFQEHMHHVHDVDHASASNSNSSSPEKSMPQLVSVGSTNSTFSYSDMMYLSSNDSSRLPSNFVDHHPSLAPLPTSTLASINTNLPNSTSALESMHKPCTPKLQPLSTPPILPNQSSAPTPVNNSSEKRAQRATLARLSSFGLHNTDMEAQPTSTTNSSIATNIGSTRNTTLSTRNSSLAPRTLSRTRNTIATPTNSSGASVNNSSAYNAKIRSAQMLLTSPLSDWLSAGAIHNGSFHNGTATALPHIEEEQNRRSSKFTFDELHQADSLLHNHEALSPSKKSSTNNNNYMNDTNNMLSMNRNTTMGKPAASLTSLLPSLSHSAHTVDPAALQNVYRSLNVLNSHFSNINSTGASSNTTTNNTNYNSTANVGAVDRELDELLAGNSIPATPRSDPSPTSHPTTTAVADASATNKSRPNSRGPRVRATGSLISQSCVDGPTASQAGTQDASIAPLLRPSTSSGAGSGTGTPTVNNATTSTTATESSKNHTGISSITLSDTNTSASGAANINPNTNSSITGVDKLGTPVHRQLDSVIAHAQRRERSGKNSSGRSGSTASTVNVHLPAHAAVLEGLEGADSSLNSGTTTSSAGNTNSINTTSTAATSTPAESQAQRLGALAAAFEAGDAVGKLMAQMMLMRNNGDASSSGNHKA